MLTYNYLHVLKADTHKQDLLFLQIL